MTDYTIVTTEDPQIGYITELTNKLDTMTGEWRKSTEDDRFYYLTGSDWNPAGGGVANLKGHLNVSCHDIVADVHITQDDEMTDDESS